MKTIRSILFTLLFFTQAQAHAQPGNSDTLYSSILKENRRVYIYLPSSYGDAYFYPRHYPVLYLLDGDSHFASVSAMIKLLSEDRGPLMFPEVIVVAIPNTDRNRDLTPTRPTHEPRMDSVSLSHTGGGEKFLSFISGELIPHIDSLYRTAPYRIFMGHSLGGLTVINAFLHHTTMFNAYVATDPSMSWDNKKLLLQAKDALKENKFTGRSLFLAIADNIPPGQDTVTLWSDTSGLFNRHMQSIFTLRNTILTAYPRSIPPAFVPFTGQPPVPEKAADYMGAQPFRFSWKYYPDYDHGTLPLPAEYDAFRFVFNYYSLNFPFPEFFQPAWTQDTLLATHYKVISRHMGYRIPPPETVVNNIGYQLMNSRQFDRAAYFFQLNIENYPESFNVYDSMGDLMAARGEKDTAIKCFQKVLTLRENPETRQKLENLRR